MSTTTTNTSTHSSSWKRGWWRWFRTLWNIQRWTWVVIGLHMRFVFSQKVASPGQHGFETSFSHSSCYCSCMQTIWLQTSGLWVG
jgi:hypothetical protein